MDDLVPLAIAMLAKEFDDDEFVLKRTAQALTIEVKLDEETDRLKKDDCTAWLDHRGKVSELVLLLDPILLLEKVPEKVPDTVERKFARKMRVLLTPKESDQVMPVLLPFLQFGHMTSATATMMTIMSRNMQHVYNSKVDTPSLSYIVCNT